LKSDQAVRGRNSACADSSHASITFGRRDAGGRYAALV